MADRIRALSGPLNGQEFPLVSGLGIGRTKGEIRLDDGKVSSLHAFVAKGPDGSLILTDNGSKNGIRVGTSKVTSLKLDRGVKFGIGNTEFEVVSGDPTRSVAPAAPIEESKPSVQVTLSKTVPPPPLEPEQMPTNDDESSLSGLSAPDIDLKANLKDVTVARPAAPPIPLKLPKTGDEDGAPAGRKWNDVLAEFATEIASSIPDQPKAIVPFNPALKFTFIGGLQAETEWTIGYGPRRIGSHSVDLPILEPSAPDICFELVPSPDGVTFRTNHPKNVRLNGAEAKLQVLKSGDVIGIGATQIEVEFLK